MKTLETYGWDDERATDWAKRDSTLCIPARVIADHGQQYKVATPSVLSAQISGSLMHKLKTTDMPKIGDWVAVEIADDRVIIHEVLSRTSEIVRGHVGRMIDKQVVAANVDLAFIVQPLDHDFSPQRLERYIFQLSAQGVSTVILLNKSDKALDAADKQEQLKSLDAQSIIISAVKDMDLSAIESYITSGKTIVVMGSSGAGKSTLINRLIGEDVQATAAIRAKDSKGRHTTVHRELFLLPGGGMIIDTPGIRELQLWGDQSDLENLFPEIFAAMVQCRYRNCSHTVEDGCMIIAGLKDGTINPKRYRIYLGFKQELQEIESKREFIQERRSQQSRESAKRRRKRSQRSERGEELIDI